MKIGLAACPSIQNGLSVRLSVHIHKHRVFSRSVKIPGFDHPGVDGNSTDVNLEELCRLYCSHVYTSVGSYVATARRLKIDRRTVKKYVDKNV